MCNIFFVLQPYLHGIIVQLEIWDYFPLEMSISPQNRNELHNYAPT